MMSAKIRVDDKLFAMTWDLSRLRQNAIIPRSLKNRTLFNSLFPFHRPSLIAISLCPLVFAVVFYHLALDPCIHIIALHHHRQSKLRLSVAAVALLAPHFI